jgi:hypothetical protein
LEKQKLYSGRFPAYIFIKHIGGVASFLPPLYLLSFCLLEKPQFTRLMAGGVQRPSAPAFAGWCSLHLLDLARLPSLVEIRFER